MKIKTVGLGFVLSILLYACKNRVNNSKAGDFGSEVEFKARQVEILFSKKCSSCHGDDGTAGIANASNLQTSKIDSSLAILTIMNGKDAMPAFKEQLTNKEMVELSSYVMTLRKKRN